MSEKLLGGDATVLTEGISTERIACRYVLLVKSGPDAGRCFDVDDGADRSRVLLGQGPACDVQLSDKQVSRRHAALEIDRRGLRYTDLGSTNGSKVKGLQVLDVFLREGDSVKLGDTEIVVQSGEEHVVGLPTDHRFGKVLGASPEMRRLYPLFARLADSTIPVVIEGETGTGKEVLAESIHEAGPRAAGPFAVFDCTAIASNLAEAALFGHERGAFTGAVTAREGLFEQAEGGTLFIDEIGDLELSLQAKLLRAIERSEVRRVGGTRWLHLDVRVIAATRRDLDREVQQGRFREDLFFRLSVARVELPPLRRREGDIRALASLFWQELGGDLEKLTSETLQRYECYEWPGNVRELRNTIARRLVLGDLEDLSQTAPARPASLEHFDFVKELLEQRLPFPIARERMIEQFQQRYAAWILKQHGDRVGEAAKASGISRRYFQTIRGRNRSTE